MIDILSLTAECARDAFPSKINIRIKRFCNYDNSHNPTMVSKYNFGYNKLNTHVHCKKKFPDQRQSHDVITIKFIEKGKGSYCHTA